MGVFTTLQIYKDFTAMAKDLRRVIKRMPKEYKYDIGDEIKKLLRDMKYQIYIVNNSKNEGKPEQLRCFIDMYNHLRILLDECIEDGVLQVKGKMSIALVIKRLIDINSQAKKWKNYVENSNRDSSCISAKKVEDDENLPF